MTAFPASTSPPISLAALVGEEPIGDILQRIEGQRKPVPPGAVTSFFASLFTIGLYPLISWPRRWSNMLESDQSDLTALAAWWQRRASPVEGRRLADIIERLQPPVFLPSVPYVIFWCLILIFGGRLVTGGFDWSHLQSMTFGWNDTSRHWYRSIDDIHLHALWVGALSIGYGAHWIVVRRHCKAVNAFAKATNRIAGYRVRPAGHSIIALGLSPLWVVSVILFCVMGAWWGVPFALVGAVQRRYTLADRAVRSAMADQVRVALHSGMPITNSAAAVASSPVETARFCQTRGCGERLPPEAKYCPRCGATAA